MIPRAALMAAVAILLANGPAQAQDVEGRDGAQRQLVVQIAYTLGEAHALHRLCAGPGDATWYARMQRLESEEAQDEASRRQLVDAFNAGYAARETQFVACSRRSRGVEREVAAHGASLAAQLAGHADPSR